MSFERNRNDDFGTMRALEIRIAGGIVSIEADLLAQVAKILGVTPEAIENFSEENVFNIINNFNDHSSNNGAWSSNPTFTFNPLDKLVEAYEENKKLYERLIEAEKDKVSYLERLLTDK